MRRALTFLLFALPLEPLRAQFATGLEFTSPAIYLNVPLGSTPLMGLLPRSADLSRLLPSPGDQGQQSSCVGWTVAYAMKSYQEAVERRWPLDQLSSQFSPAFIYNQIRRSPDCTGGTTFVDALELLRREGAATLSEFPYSEQTCSAIPSFAIKQNARSYAIADWRRVNTNDQVDVKAYVAAGIPVMIAMSVDQPFMQLSGPAVYLQYSGVSLGGHALLVVGYDDSRAAFRVINSWGRNWGDAGFGWISYAAFRQAVREGYVARDITPLATASFGAVQQRQTEPLPQPALPATAQVRILEIAHNVLVPGPDDITQVPGMRIHVQGTVLNGAGLEAQMVVRFTLRNGTPLAGNAEAWEFRDATGLVATTTPSFVVATRSFNVSRTLTIPYSLVNASPTRRTSARALNAVATIYLDRFEAALSPTKALSLPR